MDRRRQYDVATCTRIDPSPDRAADFAAGVTDIEMKPPVTASADSRERLDPTVLVDERLPCGARVRSDDIALDFLRLTSRTGGPPAHEIEK